jgi:hypothetical protein
MNKRATKRKSATENYMLKFLTVSSVSSGSIVKGIIDDIINTAVRTAEVDEQKTKYLQHFINKHDTIVSIKVITKLPNSEQSYKGKVKTHNYINRQNQSTTGKL